MIGVDGAIVVINKEIKIWKVYYWFNYSLH